MPRSRTSATDLIGYQRFFFPVMEVLKSIGGSGRSVQVKDLVAERMGISEAERAVTIKNGVSRIGNQIDWARFYLVKSGYLDSSKRGVWTLTGKARSTTLTPDVIRELVSTINAEYASARGEPTSSGELADVPSPQSQDHRVTLLNTIKALPPRGFEELSRYLLLESGFEEVTVTGRAGDGGIDGHGVLRVSKLVSMKVLFQCKRYAEAVGPGVVRDFRGALGGRAEKGIILTTGYFTTAAELEARREGVVPIELVDGERLVDLFEEMEIGLKNPRTVFDVNDDFFARFRATNP